MSAVQGRDGGFSFADMQYPCDISSLSVVHLIFHFYLRLRIDPVKPINAQMCLNWKRSPRDAWLILRLKNDSVREIQLVVLQLWFRTTILVDVFSV
jgi:hypothetical protein